MAAMHTTSHERSRHYATTRSGARSRYHGTILELGYLDWSCPYFECVIATAARNRYAMSHALSHVSTCMVCKSPRSVLHTLVHDR
ncbi:hypothetical protein BD311DRAFT_745840 [Dichomitus squalens]|uniref:Uncharacterized protein n=1 Tax=Dichomitus squalens TaxID=114155 RepID=A0A4Q9N5E9_9APHY|nr:hypothetical protein BD311DRAFT_745840 [Dichomitus squalens]